MFARVFQLLTFSTIAVVLSLLINNCESTTLSDGVATWYGSPTGFGSGGGCGFENDVGNAVYNGMIAAGNNNIYKSGKGCGACYQVKCTEHPSCSGSPITITITDECPGECNNEAFHFD
ncbi:putative expansin-B14 [Sesamum alatum]|uniref:Expansin-B14 n=1 Tax=Sesamum alatum TaxID=300844 RepID=A0AAE2CVC0_9LAMI|nr:putative expansin-B14 [Sesamum alatum]